MHDYVVADVFTDTMLEGNPLAVFLDAADIPAERMQRIARELNLSETVFVMPPESGGDVRLRIFTPVNELPFAGHPTMGTAFVIGELTDKISIIMETGMGLVPFELDRVDGKVQWARMRQPIPEWQPYEKAPHLLEALGLETSTLPIEVYRNGPRHVFVGLPNVRALSALRPDLLMLADHLDMAANCFAGAGSEWRMRMFSPAYGVAEDAATGSAAGPLAIHLGRHGLVPFGTRIEVQQGVEMGRTSKMYAQVTGAANEIGLVEVSGQAVVIARGTMLI
ncbi:PhzF family phenazine biosynthesis protein [Kibdelosporangium philippinense]|uniref:PhzF family phenazine biosynthesis protein n=1 Tax=Kibdelosporangium philippinense TaxID=211113 RepID=A0ABS8Z6N2_9PSEU|nr:PhzF family phenazine biosynthesis protein [Kibdelosporangium philippinense]MCE7001512.1 PhzF family phenazine biosynthesis protein [Kibdelosporangium philippinense]